MRAGKKPSLKTDKQKTALGSKPGVSVYGKKSALLEDAITQMNAGKYGRSSAALKELLALDPQNMEARRLFATLHLRLGSLLPARQAFESLANEALERQDYWLAESLLQEYLVAGPRCVPFIEKLGIVYQEKGDELAAVEEFGKAIDILLEDPDVENPRWPAQLYAKIRDLAPASPPAFRLASFFDAQSGELLARQPAADAELSETAASPTGLLNGAVPATPPDLMAPPEPVSEAMPWDQVVEAAPSVPSLSHPSDVADVQVSPSLPAAEYSFESVGEVALSEGAPSRIETERESGADLRADYSQDNDATDMATVSDSVAFCEASSPASEEPAFSILSESAVTDTPLPRVAEGAQALQPDQAIESVPAPMPWEQVLEATVTIPQADTCSVGEPLSLDAAAAEPPPVAAPEAPWSCEVAESPIFQPADAPADSVSAPMPWEQVQDAKVTIPRAEAASGIESRSDSSVATESPFFALSDAVQVESQGGGAPAWKTSEMGSATPEALGTDLPPAASDQSFLVSEPVSTGDVMASSADQPADVPLSAVVEEISVQPPWEPAQESPVGLPDVPQEPVSSEALLSAPSPSAVQTAHVDDTSHQELSSERSSLASEPGAAEEPVTAPTPVADSVAPPEQRPVPERTETPKGNGFSWESIFSTWKYGPSSSKTKRHYAAPVDRYQTGESLPPASPPAQPAAYDAGSAALSQQGEEISVNVPLPESCEPDPASAIASVASTDAASSAVHEVSDLEASAGTVILPEPGASPIFSDQRQEISITIPSTEPYETDSAAAMASGSESAVGDVIQDSATLPDQTEVTVAPAVVPATPSSVYEEVSSAVHEVLVSEDTPISLIPPEPVASFMVRDQAQENPVTIPSTESFLPESAAVFPSAPDSAASEMIPDSVTVPPQPEATVPTSPTLAAAREPVQLDSLPGADSGVRWDHSAMGMATVLEPVLEPTIEVEPLLVVPVQEVEAHEVSSPAAVSPEPLLQPEELPIVSSGEVVPLVSVEEAEFREATAPVAVRPELPVQPEEFRFIASDEAPSLAPKQDVASYEASHSLEISPEPSVQSEELRTVSSNDAKSLAPAKETERWEPSSSVSTSVEPSVQPKDFRFASPDKATSSNPVPVVASGPVPSAGEEPFDVAELIPPALTREILPVLQTLVSQLSGAAKESPVASPAPGIIESVHPVPEIPQASMAVASSPAIEPSGLATESAQVPPQEMGQPTHWKTGEVSVQTYRPSREAPQSAADEEPVLPPIAPRVEETQAIEPERPSLDVPATAGPVISETQPLPPQEKEAWIRTGESIRFIDLQAPHPARPAAPASGRSGEPAGSTVASAVDALFESSGRMTRTQTSERTTVPKPRPRIGAKLARLRLSLSAFIGSCFSTTHALIVALVGLVVLAGALAAIAIGAVGVAWVIMEEKPSAVFQSQTAAPQRSPMDARKNGYLLLLGFDAEAGADPMQAGHERRPAPNEDESVSACLGETDGRSGGRPINATASVADGWFRSANPVAQFKTKADGLKGWIGQAQASVERYRQWLKMPFEDWGYGQSVVPPCASILFAHRLYVAEGFALGRPADAGTHRLQDDMEAWRTVLGQAKTLPVKMLAVQAIQDDIAVASGLLAQPDFDSKELPVLTSLLRPFDQVESSMRWPMQSELAAAGQATDAQLKEDRGDEMPWHVTMAKWLPLPKQRRLNEYAAYYDASSKAAGEGRYGAMPKRTAYVKNQPATVMDYLTNPIENIVGLKPLSSWDRYNGMVIDTDARLRLASVQAWLRRGSQEGELVTRIAKAGQRFYDPYTGLPMLVNLKRGVIYSVGHDGKDQDADPQQDVVVSIPFNPASSGSSKVSSGSMKPK